jgi:hypothetical protein
MAKKKAGLTELQKVGQMEMKMVARKGYSLVE